MGPALARAIETTGKKGKLGELLSYKHEVLKDYPEAKAAMGPALARAIQVKGEEGDLQLLGRLAKNRTDILNAHPEALLALLETLARNPQPQKNDYREAVQNTNNLLETEFNNNEKLSELFLSSKNGKEVLLLLAKNKNFPTINNWLARTKEALPAETLSLIKDTDAHQRESRKSLATSSNASNSGNSVDKCLRFLRLVSLKYSH